MKRLILMTFLMVGITIVAQPRLNKHQKNSTEKFTPEQRSELAVKKLTLELDLNEAQQKEMKSFFADKNTKMAAMKTAMKERKEKGTKLTNDERFEMKIKMLDDQIASKKRMEKMLNVKQFEKWTVLKEENKDNSQERGYRQHLKGQKRRG